MKHPITTTLGDDAYQFLVTQTKQQKKNMNAILEKALKLYKKRLLKKQIEEGLKRDNEELCQIANSILWWPILILAKGMFNLGSAQRCRFKVMPLTENLLRLFLFP